MKNKLLIFMMIISTGLFFTVWDMTRIPKQIHVYPNTEHQKTFEQAPEFSFTTLDGAPYELRQFTGKIVVLNFWATWCIPCIAEFPQLLELASTRPDDVVLIALSVDDDPDKIKPFFEKFSDTIQNKLTLPNVLIGHDENKIISRGLYQTRLYPESFIIGPDQTIRRKVAGVIEWMGEDFLNFLENITVP